MSSPAPWHREYECRTCAARHIPDERRWRCDCGGLLDLVGGYTRFPLDAVPGRRHGLWRWREALPFAPGAPEPARVWMGEGEVPAVAVQLGGVSVTATVEYASPTQSFKDRGAAVLVATALRLGATRVVADSSGNAGAAIAAYAARAGLRCDLYAPAGAAQPKLAQARAHGAEIHLVGGDREDVAGLAAEHAGLSGAFYASHSWNPFFLEGTKTWAFDVVLELGRAPDVVVLPVGNGTLLLGADRGFRELQRAGVTDAVPRIVAVQAALCAPLAAAFDAGAAEVEPRDDQGTIAAGIAVGAPVRGAQCLDAVRASDGTVVAVDDDGLLAAQAELARQGLFVEPTAAAPAAGLAAAGVGEGDGVVALPLCGAGLKAP